MTGRYWTFSELSKLPVLNSSTQFLMTARVALACGSRAGKDSDDEGAFRTSNRFRLPAK